MKKMRNIRALADTVWSLFSLCVLDASSYTNCLMAAPMTGVTNRLFRALNSHKLDAGSQIQIAKSAEDCGIQAITIHGHTCVYLFNDATEYDSI
ncbi:MAG: tRNA-dihydrouridine synthase B [Sodalis sp.]|nr:MAG: tRNA-dihydrouridine synthase B [Sodalis sp.]